MVIRSSDFKDMLKSKSFLYKTITMNFYLFSALVLFSCRQTPHSENSVNNTPFPEPDTFNIPYDLENPNSIYKLPSALYEISGIAIYKDNLIACVQDEKGIVYLYDLDKEEVIKKIKFAKDGDFEDIAVVDGTIYVLKNNGNIYRIKKPEKKDPKVKKITTPLSAANDCEGLEYDQVSNSLLIACKGTASYKNHEFNKGSKAIYAINLDSLSFNAYPAYLVDVNIIFESMELDSYLRVSNKIMQHLNPGRNIVFQPSGVAVHPISNHIYILASVGKLLVVLDRDGRILEIEPLNKNIFRQPEGICFDANGDLYISNEGKGGKGTILIFNQIN